MKNTDWIVAHAATGPDPYAFECKRCGDLQRIALPISVDAWVAMAEVFRRHHQNCRPRPPQDR